MPDISYYTDQTPAMARHRKAFTTMVLDIMFATHMRYQYESNRLSY